MEALATMDALMLAGETFGSAMHVGLLLVFTPPRGAGPGYADDIYRDSLADTHTLDPRLRRHPHRGIDTGGVWTWREEAEVDLRRHVRRESLPPGSGMPALWELVSRLHGERLDMAAPLWGSWLIDGLAGGRHALYIKIHHIVIDGVGGLRMIADSLSPDPKRRDLPPFYADRTTPEPAHGRPRFRNPLAAVRAVADAAAAGIDLTRRVAAAELATLAGDTVVAPMEAPRTRFNAKLSAARTATGTALPSARVRAVQEAAAVTGNDVVTAVIAGALRAWLGARGELPDESLVAMVPVTVRSRDDDGDDGGSGNRFGLGLCPLGTAIADPVARLTLIHDAMAGIKHQVASKGPDAMLAVMGPAIGSTIVPPLLPFGVPVPPSCNLAISKVPGPRERMYFNGARLDELYPVSVAFDGMGLNVTLCTYDDTIAVGYVSDREVMPDIGDLVGLTEAALAELEAALGVC